MRNDYELADDVTSLLVNTKTRSERIRIDTVDLPRAQQFPGTWGVKRTATGMTYVQGAIDGHIVLLHRWLARAGPETRVRLRGDWRDHRRMNLIVTPRRSPVTAWAEGAAAQQERREAGWWLRLSLLLAERMRKSETTAWRLVCDWRKNRLVAKKTAAAIEECTRELERGMSLPFPVAAPGRLRHHWYHHVREIVEALQELPDTQWIGRADVEKIFGLSRASALRVLVRFGARSTGRALGLDAKTLRERLDAFASDSAVTWERERRERLSEALTDAGRVRKARAVRVPLPAAGWTLSSTVRLTPGRLEIDFRGMEDLLRQLMELGQAMAADYEAFARAASAGD